MVQNRKIERRCISYEGHVFKPLAVPMKDLDQITLTKEEITALYYSDFLSIKQNSAAEKMGISQASLSRDLATAHSKIADAFFNTKAILFEEPEEKEDE